MLVVLGIMVLYLAVILFKSIVIVPHGCEYVVESFGKYKCTLYSGVNFITPFVDRVVKKTNKTEEFFGISNQDDIIQR